MMTRFQVWAAVALLGLNIVTVMADGSCVPTCVNDVQNKNFQEIGCAAANQNGCLCMKSDKGWLETTRLDSVFPKLLNKLASSFNIIDFIIDCTAFDFIAIASFNIAHPDIDIDTCVHFQHIGHSNHPEHHNHKQHIIFWCCYIQPLKYFDSRVWSRKKQAAPRHSMDISKPLPGSGRTYPARDDRGRDSDSYDKYGNDIEMTSNRYEDMIPSQQPRTMV
ncbi:hypothetical protein LMH87_000972 [Akanthomyces muscarius]|uniref:Extracellular membrane protein CFEM domain-containing protein n=1 Tax=Akanthomyces muscarius TaxID=2231603 RepID=A0A9W8QGE9_AKAMU|nr:hypothetical protein LMH87_000972 [Akanthomyces muscarius]KAJ4155741.1 hypothetical protein LMH87_000972 [Akanthomyces muscarius]